ncbi:heparinase II/III family protein [Coprinopsis marcescibilis]|uniref:Heparinase II/III family protein n=1 Tax=Coprinopsis marcescibilis TaxID=230819 RepID=A0A5C3KSK7_COPMA|nr:heparinase II/III family protein [Coprinopsis marcescibilis]
MSYQQYDNTPYKESNAAYAESSTGFLPPRGPVAPQKRGLSPWIKFGVPIFIVVAVGAVVGGVLGSRKSSTSGTGNGTTAGGAAGNNGNGNGNGGRPATGTGAGSGNNLAIATATDLLAAGRFAVTTNTQYMVPVYPTSVTNSALFAAPTIAANAATWPNDPFTPANPNPLEVRPDRPRLIAPTYKWDALANLIQSDPYLQGWNETIFGNATAYRSSPMIVYNMDGESGILDNAREFKMRIKAYGYAYRVSRNTEWADRAYAEIEHVTAPGFGPDDDTKWNPGHFLDTAEYAAAFGIAYDWFHDVFTDDQKAYIRQSLVQYALGHGRDVYENGATFGWWRTGINGNWNCVCNGGLTIASLAILGEDDSGLAETLLRLTVDNAKENCARAVTEDGSWMESPNYWYFGTTGHAEMTSALLTATGSDYGMLDINPNYWRTGTFHMYVYGPTSLFDFGDHGPNKFSTTANCMFLIGDRTNHPEFILHQREQHDAAEPWSMFWYNPAATGAFWSGLALDNFFDAPAVQWASMRSSWTDPNALYVAIKAGLNQDHQTHNDLDVGDFVLDALGTRWAGELGSGNYLNSDFFLSQDQDAGRWRYYRKHTAGQNTIMINRANQNVESAPTVQHGSSGTVQGDSTDISIPSDSTAFWTTDMTSAYFEATSVRRGIRLLNARRQVLLQDEVDAQADFQWRMHTNATVTVTGTTAQLELDGETMSVSLLDAPAGAEFSVLPAERQGLEPAPNNPDQENPGVSVLAISVPAGSHTLRVLFNPQWPGMAAGDFVTPPNVPLADWGLRSHD